MSDQNNAPVPWESCCRGRKNCPQLAVLDTEVLIKDDDGNVIKIAPRYLPDLIESLMNVSAKLRGWNKP